MGSETEANSKRNRSEFKASKNMYKRDTCIFYRSMFESIKELPIEVQAELYNAIFEYSLDFVEPVLSGLSMTFWRVIRPILEKANTNYINGSRPKTKEIIIESEANTKRIGSEIEAKPKRLGSEREAYKDKDKDKDIRTIYADFSEIEIEPKKEAKKKKGVTYSLGADGTVAKSFKQWKPEDLKQGLAPHVEKYGRDLCNEFYRYWSEPTASGKMRMNGESAFEITRRLDTFQRNAEKFGSKQKVSDNQLHFKTKREAEQYIIDKYYHGKAEYGPAGYGVEMVDENNQPRDIDVIRDEVNRKVLGNLNL